MHTLHRLVVAGSVHYPEPPLSLRYYTGSGIPIVNHDSWNGYILHPAHTL